MDVKVNFLTTNDIPRKGELQVPRSNYLQAMEGRNNTITCDLDYLTSD